MIWPIIILCNHLTRLMRSKRSTGSTKSAWFERFKRSEVDRISEIARWNPTFYNIICWFAGTNDSSTKHVILFFNFLLKTLYFYFCKFMKKKLKWFLQRVLQEIMKKNNTWNIWCLVDESFVPANQRIIL